MEDVWLWLTSSSLGTVGGSLDARNQDVGGVWIQPGAVSSLLRIKHNHHTFDVLCLESSGAFSKRLTFTVRTEDPAEPWKR